MLSRSISPMICASGGDDSAAISVAEDGGGAAGGAPVVNSAGLSTTSEYLSGPERAPTVPRTVIVPSGRRDALIRPPVPPTTRTEASIVSAVVAGSRVTDALFPSGRTTTQTRFSFRESAETRAAYA